ncbi:MAG: hypothetical protein NVS3B20_06770 [Polyangiales bacterium]
MSPIRSTPSFVITALLFALASQGVACGGATDSSPTGESSEALGYEHYPTHEAVVRVLEAATFTSDPAWGRAGRVRTVADFFRNSPAYADYKTWDQVAVELRRDPYSRDAFSREELIPVLRINQFGNNDHTEFKFDARKNVRVYEFADSFGVVDNPFPVARDVTSQKVVLQVAVNDFHKFEDPPKDITPEELQREFARVAVWTYVTSSINGPLVSKTATGLAHFRNASGRYSWRGVSVDNATSLVLRDANADPRQNVTPWGLSLTPNRVYESPSSPWSVQVSWSGGSIKASDIPHELVDTLKQIVARSNGDIATRLGYDRTPTNPPYAAIEIAKKVKERAQEVLKKFRLTEERY